MTIAKQLPKFSGLLLGWLLFGFSVAPVSALVDFPIGYVSKGGTYAFIALIEQQRLLEQEGIRPAFIYIGGPQISQTLIAGDIRMAIVAAASPVRAAAHGAPMQFVGSAIDREVLALISNPKIRSPESLKGARLAIDRFGDYTDFLARKVLERFGLQPQKDVFLVQIGSQTSRFAAVKSGQVHATFVAPPLTLVAEKAGLYKLADLGDLGFPSSSASMVVLRQTTEQYSKEVYAVLRAIAKALRIFKTDKEAAIGALSRFMRLNDPEALEETRRVHAKFYKNIPAPSADGIKAVQDFLGQTDSDVRRLTTERLIDTQFTDRLERELGK